MDSPKARAYWREFGWLTPYAAAISAVIDAIGSHSIWHVLLGIFCSFLIVNILAYCIVFKIWLTWNRYPVYANDPDYKPMPNFLEVFVWTKSGKFTVGHREHCFCYIGPDRENIYEDPITHWYYIGKKP